MSKTEENTASSMSSRLTENETKISFLIKDVEDCSDIVASLIQQLEQITKQVSFLTQKETERDTSSGIVLGDKPPHW